MALSSAKDFKALHEAFLTADQERWRRVYETGNNEYYYDGYAARRGVRCQNCLVLYDRGIAGDEAANAEEARVSAHANGWYVTGSAIICPPCRRKIAEGIQEDE